VIKNAEMCRNVPSFACAPVTKRTHCAHAVFVLIAAAGLVAVPSIASAQQSDMPLFKEVTAAVGFPEKPPTYPDGRFLTPEITPGGVAVLDYNNDGRLDLLVICHPPPMPHAEMIKATAPNRLYRQETDGNFVEVDGAAGLGGSGFHHGVAVGDVNNDGFVDVYISNYGSPDQLFLNNGNATFTDATSRAGFLPMTPQQAEKNWASTCAFFDYDRDGNLDLFVTHFATFDPNQECLQAGSRGDKEYCGPHEFPGQLSSLYKGNGDGTFRDVTKAAGIDAPGRGWGLLCADLTGDGWPDILQANDEEPNQLWVNQQNGTFMDEAMLRGCALNAAGSVEANMGVHAADVTNSKRLDLFITHISSETNTLWRSEGEGNWIDATAQAGMALVDRPFTGWGCGFFDYDNDGFLDLAVANGRVARGPSRPDADVGTFWNRYAEPNLLFRGDGTGKFADVTKHAGTFGSRLEVTRALAFADLGNRGAIDLISAKVDNSIRVWRNDAATKDNHWLQVLPMTGKRDAIGAKVFLPSGGKTRLALALRAYSYLSSNDPRVHFGLGKQTTVESVEIHWPHGNPAKEKFNVDGVDRVMTVRQGTGKPIP
jgi:enediyne biosynthesis protein E4